MFWCWRRCWLANPMGLQFFHSGNTTNHKDSSDFPSFFIKQKRKPYIFRRFSRFVHSKIMNTIHISMVFYLFEVLGSLGKQISKLWRPASSKTSQDLTNLENHGNIYGFHLFGIIKRWKPLEYVLFSFRVYEKHRTPLEYVCFLGMSLIQFRFEIDE